MGPDQRQRGTADGQIPQRRPGGDAWQLIAAKSSALCERYGPSTSNAQRRSLPEASSFAWRVSGILHFDHLFFPAGQGDPHSNQPMQRAPRTYAGSLRTRIPDAPSYFRIAQAPIVTLVDSQAGHSFWARSTTRAFHSSEFSMTASVLAFPSDGNRRRCARSTTRR